MNKSILLALTAGLATLALSGAALSADESGAPQQDPAAQPTQGSGSQPAQRDAAKDKDAYFAALAKCDALKGVAEKQQCVDSVRKQNGQM
jgi:hypothetical protein